MEPAHPAHPPAAAPRPGAFGGAIIMVAAVLLAYAGAWRVPFLFDDFAAIVENPTIRDLRDWRAVLTPPPNTGVTGRPLVNATLALNHAFGGLDPRGYHALNVLLHAAAALVLFGILRRMLGTEANGLAWAVALLWAVHPLQTESVVCVVQRNEVLMALCFLLTLYAFQRAAATNATGARAWGAGAGWCAWLCAASKEVAVVLPLVVLLYDRTFVSASWREVWRRHGAIHGAICSSWLLLAWLVHGTDGRGDTVGFGLSVSTWDYLLTQARALWIYAGRTVWPDPLVLDYGTPVVRALGEVAFRGVAVFALLGATGWAVVRKPRLGFAGCVFFAVLAPSSSVLPLTTQTIAEHRMYLPLVVPLALLALGVRRASGRGSGAALAVAVVASVALTIARNRDYRSETALWADTVAKAPDNPRAHNNLGLVLFHAGQIEAAQREYEAALRLDARYAPAHANLGDLLAKSGRLDAAIASYVRAVELVPSLSAVQAKLARQLLATGRMGEAWPHFAAALDANPDDTELRHVAAVALLRTGRVAEAIAEFERVVTRAPTNAEAWNNLGTALLAAGRVEEARRRFEGALRIRPDYVRARQNLERLPAAGGRSN